MYQTLDARSVKGDPPGLNLLYDEHHSLQERKREEGDERQTEAEGRKETRRMYVFVRATGGVGRGRRRLS
jgi:hypothetical protein